VTSFCRTAGMLALAAFFTADHARSEDLDCTRYVPQIGKTVRVRCNDQPAAAPPEPKPTPSEPGPDQTPGHAPTSVREAVCQLELDALFVRRRFIIHRSTFIIQHLPF